MTFKSARVLASLVTLLGLGAGCDAPTPSPQAACSSFGVAICQRIRTCEPVLVDAIYVDAADCEKATREGCVLSAQAPDSLTTAVEIAACAQEVANASCQDFASGLCRNLSAGKRKSAQGCVTASQCESLACVWMGQEACGRCSANGASGAVCRGSSDCGQGLACQDGRCRATSSLGSNCVAAVECPGSLVCREGKCSLTDNTTPISIRTEGQACGFTPAQWAICRGGLYCRDGTCVPTLAPGAACTGSTPCGRLQCIQATCQMLDAGKCPA